MKLTTEESRILRRGLAPVQSLIAKGLVSPAGEITQAGRDWIAADNERIRKARAEGGAAGPEGWKSERKRKQIALKASKAAARARKKRKKASHDEN